MLRWLVVGCLIAIFALTLPAQTSARREIEAALQSGKGVVLAVSDSAHKADDEGYGDWADNLNQFGASKGTEIKIVKLSPLMYGRLFTEPKLKGPFATVFMRDAGHAFWYDGRIVEQKVYVLGAGYLSGKADVKAMSDYGLMETSVRLRKR